VDYAKYIGTATTRIITSQEWNVSGIKGQKTLTWGTNNGYTVSRDDITDEAWAVLAVDPGFIVVGEQAKPDEEYEARVQAAKNRLANRMVATQGDNPAAPVEAATDVSEA
jgi:hypothetical protein